MIFLTSKDEDIDEVVGFKMGADDYIRKPFSQRLLVERIRAVLRRADTSRADDDREREETMVRGDLVLEPSRHLCTWRDQPVTLTVTEFLILKSLASRPGHVRSRDQLMDATYDDTRLCRRPHDRQPHQAPPQEVQGHRRDVRPDRDAVRGRVPLQGHMTRPPASEIRRDAHRPPRQVHRGPFSSLTRRILAINVLALGIVVVGLLYLDDYRQGLIDAKADALATQGEIIAAALGETVVVGDAEGIYEIDIDAARQLLSRLVLPTGRRARLFAGDGRLIADSRQLTVTGGEVQAEALPPPGDGPALRRIEAVYEWIFDRLPPRETLERYVEAENQSADDYREAHQALAGDSAWSLRDGGELGVQLIVAVPVQRFKLVQGALLLSTSIADVEESLREVRFAILELFVLGLGITVLLFALSRRHHRAPDPPAGRGPPRRCATATATPTAFPISRRAATRSAICRARWPT